MLLRFLTLISEIFLTECYNNVLSENSKEMGGFHASTFLNYVITFLSNSFLDTLTTKYYDRNHHKLAS